MSLFLLFRGGWGKWTPETSQDETWTREKPRGWTGLLLLLGNNGSVPKWTPGTSQDETWAAQSQQSETWTERTKQDETWT